MKKKTLYIIIAAVLVVLLAVLLIARGNSKKDEPEIPEGVAQEDTWAYVPAEETTSEENAELWNTVIPDFTGKWFIENTGKANVEVYAQQDSTISFIITVTDGDSSVAADIKDVGCIGTTGSFYYTDSNGGSGYGEIRFSGDDVYLSFEIEKDPDGLNVSDGAGRYVPAEN